MTGGVISNSFLCDSARLGRRKIFAISMDRFPDLSISLTFDQSFEILQVFVDAT